jgi:hypothetical protein
MAHQGERAIAGAQQPAMPVIGFLHLTSLETNRENLAALSGMADELIE